METGTPLRPLEEIRAAIRKRSPFDAERTEKIIHGRYDRLPKRLEAALSRWPLQRSRVLDIGCSFGHCLVHFGPGSLGIDNVTEHVEFCRSLGLDAIRTDVDTGLEGLPDAAFDYVWVSDIVEHLDAPRLLLRRLARTLQPDGELLLHLTILPSSRVARALARRRRIAPFDAHAHHYQFTLDTAVYLLERSGYRVTRVVAPLPVSLGPLERAVARHLPRVMLAARPDAAADRLASEAELRNKPPAEGPGSL